MTDKVAGDRIREGESGLREQPPLQRRIDEGERDRLLVPAGGQGLEERLFGGALLGQREEGLRRAAAVSGIASKPTMRATSSIRSASIAISKRCAGGITVQPAHYRGPASPVP